MEKLTGVHAAVVSFFSENSTLDLPSLERHLHWLADQGVHGFVPCGTTGESAVLTEEEWHGTVGLTVRVAKERNLLVTAGCGSNNTAVAIEKMKVAKGLGADAALLVTPYYNKPTQSGLLAHYTAIAKAGTGLPIILYNVPGRTAVSLSVPTIQALWELPEVMGIKEASGQYGTWMQIAHELDLSKKAFLAGDDDAVAIVAALGGSGVISASANVAPRAFVALHELCVEQKWKQAFELQTRLVPLIKAMFMETNPAPAKYALAHLRNMPEFLRLPLVSVSEESKRVIREAIAGLEQMP